MEMNTANSASNNAVRRMHPLAVAAAVSVIIASLTAAAAMTGVLSKSQGSGAESSAQVVAPTPQAAASSAAQENTQSPVAPAARRATATPKSAAREHTKLASTTPREQTRNEPAPQTAQAQLPPPPPAAPRNTGVVTSVREISQPGEGTGLGAVAGGVLGAVLGNQVGNGSGKKIMTVAGAAGGAYAGHEIEKRTRGTKRWEVSVRMDNGTVRTITTDAEPSWRSGDRVRVVSGTLQPA